MMKAVNMKDYRFGQLANRSYKGFGILDTATNTFLSVNGLDPYVLEKKRYIQLCIDSNCVGCLDRVAHC